ncbi:MAG TPA: thiamine pyrophosphate-dependent enzyme [Acidimicrobiales bacterium]|nr:thiamine pyrophosphate-dependent enzyme [Acidimicrobiales bacterium]
MAVEPATASPAAHRGYPTAELVEDYRTACLSRALDDREMTLQKQSRVFFQISGAGHEALLVALARSLRPGHDWFFPYYRDQALVLALGVTVDDVLLQAVGSAADPASGGRQMPSHWGSVPLHIVTQSSPTATQCLPAVGCAEAAGYINRHSPPGTAAEADEVTYVSLGEGATAEGEFWEAVQAATRLRLPVLFVVADNGYAISVRSSDQLAAPVARLVAGFTGLRTVTVDGCDYFAARAAGEKAVAGIRRGDGPVLLHATVTRPYSHSSADTQAKYRPVRELQAEASRDPLHAMAAELVSAGVLSVGEADAVRQEAVATVAAAAARAVGAPAPDPARVLDHLTGPVVAGSPDPPAGTGAPVTMAEAIRATLHEAMAADVRIRVFGEDVADAPDDALAAVEGKGGVFGLTAGLQRSFGSDRCFNTPVAEASIVGRAVGQALRGLRPVPEVQFFDYIWPAMQQIRSEAATIRWRSNGSFSCPMVLRVPIGGYLDGGAIWHSQCGESIFAHTPGLLLAFPSRAADAVGLLRTALAGSDPVLFCEHKHLLRQAYAKDPIPETGWRLPFGRAALRRPGRHLSIVTWGATVERSLRAAALLAEEEGVEPEVLDLRTLAPWDREAVAAAVARTGRLLVVHEDVLTCGFGAEVAAWAGENCFSDLDAPVTRLAAMDCHVPYNPGLERAVLPQVDDIVAAAGRLAAF